MKRGSGAELGIRWGGWKRYTKGGKNRDLFRHESVIFFLDLSLFEEKKTTN